MTAIELKSTQGSLTFWRSDFDLDGKKHSYNIKKNQILGLQKWDKYLMNCGLVFNFRNKDNRTYFVYINDFIQYTNELNKKSINIEDVMKMNPIEINAELKRVNYRYDIDNFLKTISL